eukprot:CAMPEP_0203877382 /NCGR_PEP_ID=MMETSP0359-20131031/21977_1 /ASSEMBLY_ACC=CAM_ASM_000338 /TAXON_ID=268821 /ORGANISM="Scrippsiella Hangoei, Strain SHTV-5" /LENGTH=788 /DNA_ID=CAMNT_0050796327 /DNA_START=55 /DNA_END=2418 /DNA_ORIENTATION=+
MVFKVAGVHALDGSARESSMKIGRKMTNLENASAAMMKLRDSKTALSQDVEELKGTLARNGDGSLLRGWRRHMDPEGELQVNFQDFIQACARFSYFGDTLAIFGLDPDPNLLGFQSLAPEEGAVLEKFKHWMKATFGSPAAFFAAAAGNGEKELSRDAFCTKSVAAGYEDQDELTLVFDCCDTNGGGEDSIFYEDLIFLEADEEARSLSRYTAKLGKLMEWKQSAAQEYWEFQQQRELAKKEGSGFHQAHRRAPRPWLDRYFDEMPAVKSQLKVFRIKEQCRRSRLARNQFQEHVRRTFGNDIRAWRKSLAPTSFEITQQSLRSYCGTHNLKVNAKDVWDGLDQDHDGVVHFDDYNVRQAMALAKFQQWARQSFGSCEAIWRQPDAAAVSRTLTGIWFPEKAMAISTFTAVVKKLGWPDLANQEVRRLVFQGLDLQAFGTIQRSDLVWLDGWHPLEWVTAEPKLEEWEKLKALLKQNYGHLLRAWRLLLDRDDSNGLSWVEFRDACRRLKFDGDVGACWRVLDSEMTGMISMKEYDAESFDILNSFKEWADMHFGGILACFKELDEDHSGSVSLKEMNHACRKLRWTGDANLLFNCIHVSKNREAGVRSIALSDIAFLDTWQLEPTEEELAADDLPLHKSQKRAKVTKVSASVNEHLASPINIGKLGFTDWHSASVGSLSHSPIKRSMSDTRLPNITSSPYAKPLWGLKSPYLPPSNEGFVATRNGGRAISETSRCLKGAAKESSRSGGTLSAMAMLRSCAAGPRRAVPKLDFREMRLRPSSAPVPTT